MDEVKARVKLAESEIESPLGVSLPRSEVERALQEKMDAELTLDVVRSNGSTEQQRLAVILDEPTLRRLVEQEGEQVRVVIDTESLQAAFDDVEAHGLREGMATLAILVTAAAGGAGMAGAAVDQSTGAGAQSDPATFVAGATDFPSGAVDQSTEAQPAFVAGATDFPTIQASVQEAGMPRAMPSDYAAQIAAEHAAAGNLPRAMPSDYATAAAGEPLPSGHIAAPPVDNSMNAIENVRAGGSAIPDPDSAIENVRATRDLAPAGDTGGGIEISAPGAGITAMLAGGVALTIAAAAFALRRRREPEPAT
jgi:hypothetical protein